MTTRDLEAHKAVAIVQARMGSTRLPGKTLELLGSATVLRWVVNRLFNANSIDEVIVATSDGPEDDVVETEALAAGATVFRGSSEDVLSRYRGAAQLSALPVIVRVTADCPLIDPSIVDEAVRLVGSGVAEYVSTSLDGRFPRGLDVEAFQRELLEIAAVEAVAPDEREHVTLYLYRRPDRFVCEPVVAPPWAQRPDLRITLDEAADLELLRAVVDNLDATADVDARDVLGYLDEHSEIARINADVAHRNVS